MHEGRSAEERTQLLRLVAHHARGAAPLLADPLVRVLQALASQDWAAMCLQPNEA